MTIDAFEQATAELSAGMVPWPDDYVEDLTPSAALVLCRQMAMATLKVVMGGALSLDEDPDESAGVMDEIVNGCAAAVAGLTHACVALELLPVEAEEALEAGQ